MKRLFTYGMVILALFAVAFDSSGVSQRILTQTGRWIYGEDNNTIRPEQFATPGQVFGNGVVDDTALVQAAHDACSDDGGCKIQMSCRNWTFNLVVTKPNVWLDGCGSWAHTWWNATGWQAYDVNKPVVKVDSAYTVYGYKTNTGFQLTNAHFRGNNSDGTKEGKYGLHIRSSEYHNIHNVNIANFDQYQLKLGDSVVSGGTDLAGDEWVYFGNFSNISLISSRTTTSGDTIRMDSTGGQVTSQNFVNYNIYGPGASGGYTLRDVLNVRFTNGWMQILDNHGLYKSGNYSGIYTITNSFVENDNATGCTFTSNTNAGTLNMVSHVGGGMNGNYCDSDGVRHLLDERYATLYMPYFYSAVHGGYLYFLYGIDADETDQISFAHRVRIGREAGDVLAGYAAQGTTFQGQPTTGTTAAALTAFQSGSNTSSYALNAQVYAGIPILSFLNDSDDGTTNLILPNMRAGRWNRNATVINGYGSYFDLRLSQATGWSEDAAARITWAWTDATVGNSTSYLSFSTRGRNRFVESLAIKPYSMDIRTYRSADHIINYHMDSDDNQSRQSSFLRMVTEDNTAGNEKTAFEWYTSGGYGGANKPYFKWKVNGQGPVFPSWYVPATNSTACEKGAYTWEDNGTHIVEYRCVATNSWDKSSRLLNTSW